MKQISCFEHTVYQAALALCLKSSRLLWAWGDGGEFRNKNLIARQQYNIKQSQDERCCNQPPNQLYIVERNILTSKFIVETPR